MNIYKKVITAIDSKGKEKDFVAVTRTDGQEKSILRILIDGLELIVDEKGCFKHPNTCEQYMLKLY